MAKNKNMAPGNEVSERETSNVFEWLKSKDIDVDVEWLEACMSYMKSRAAIYENFMQLRNDVFKQYLLSDICQSGGKYLPDQLSNREKTFIQRSIVLQMNSIIDIGESAYSQLKKLKKENQNTTTESSNERWQPKPCRMLKLKLTDGEQLVEGMEYKPMRKLNLDLKPGTKILIKGSTMCRRGMLLLTDDTVEILGGELPRLTEENSVANILQNLVTNAKGGGNKENEGNRNEQRVHHQQDDIPDDVLSEIQAIENMGEDALWELEAIDF